MNTTIWEYHILMKPPPAKLAALGQQGWELVAVTCIVTWFWRSEKAFFKRPKMTGVPPSLEPSLK